jgi:ketosteroid isomerase-like protein
MNREEILKLAEKSLSAWNGQVVDEVLDCYTEDCVYLDPNTQGPVKGRDSFRKYLTKLFQMWKMHWSLREFFPFSKEDGGAFLWRAELTPATGGKSIRVYGMDLIIVRGDRISRNEVYFDRMAIFSEMK